LTAKHLNRRLRWVTVASIPHSDKGHAIHAAERAPYGIAPPPWAAKHEAPASGLRSSLPTEPGADTHRTWRRPSGLRGRSAFAAA